MPSLTRTEAADRSALLTIVSYHVDLDLSTGPEVFRATTTIVFDSGDQSRSTFLDVRPETLHSITLNGVELDPAALSDGRFPLTGLAQGDGTQHNELVVVADMAYSTTAQGLHRAVDPADGKVYVYGSVFLDHAPRVFACFDQPDLKAPMTFVVTVPEDDWQVLGTGVATKRADGRWEVVQEVGQATYLTTIVAGPYASFRTVHDGVPLGLHCRASVADAVGADADEIFRVTGQCLDELHRLFGIRFPFPSFEQVFAPEFSFLSLDHPGCVLIKELYLFTTPVPRSEHETRAVVIAHGLSLQWLAGLVTNSWWNDVWLSQAFADYMAHRVPSEVTEFTGPLTTFAARRKGQAYVADQRPSTHPVAIEGKDALSALLDLDRISYFKGSSALRQLATHLGDDKLRAALRIYFDRHAYGSATYDDFNAALSEAAGRDMTDWSRRWLMTPNVTTLGADLTIADGKITAAAITQDVPASHPVYRPHTLDVGLYGPGDTHETVRVDVDGPRTELPALVGRPAPDLVLVNENDRTYAKIRYDARSLAALPERLPELESINRGMVWCTLLMGVQDGTVTPAEHLALVCDMVAAETELSIVIEVLEQARIDIADRYLDPALRPELMVRVADACRDRLTRTTKDDELGMPLLRGLIEFTADTGELRGWLNGTALPAGIELDVDLAWRIRYRLAVLGAFDEAAIEAAYQADPTTQAEAFAAKCRAARPDADAKAAAWQAITEDATLSSYRLWALAEGFWQPEQHALTEPYVARFFEEMPKVAGVHSDKVLDTLVLWLFPRYAASPRTLEHAEKFLAREDLPLALRRRAADQTDDLRRVVSTR
ncbi:aminopeptidase N [Labedaea rhizosphaerae]|uniref:Aminopeptidase N n=1 Tax=Labedaea rhizosphaerae TaxID=598644 RepID=A0A4R6S5P0_LABRH|nr:aminopeptidase N [Labedaea rhizosphaerae]TDP94055.1 aminopeptidase N [Labedaea rhizosphaerae]